MTKKGSGVCHLKYVPIYCSDLLFITNFVVILQYHERALVFNESNMIRLFDVAYDGYNGYVLYYCLSISKFILTHSVSEERTIRSLTGLMKHPIGPGHSIVQSQISAFHIKDHPSW